jgi:large subunit ribosomal protein L10
MVRSDKIDLVNRVSDKLKSSQSVILTDFRGLTVAEMTTLRRELRKKGVEFKVIKNRLGKRALNDAGCDSLDEYLTGNTAWAFGLQDAVEPAKILSKFAKDHQKLVIKGGLLESRRINAGMITQLANLPSRPELLSRMAGVLKQPATKVACAMNASLTKVARAFQALADKKAAAGEQAGA